MAIEFLKNEQITMIIPAYEQTELIEACLESVAEQSFRDFSVVCFADPADIDTLQAIKSCLNGATTDEMRALDQKTELRTLKQAEVASSIDKIIARRSSKYVIFVHPGDILNEDFLAEAATAAEAGDAQMVICNTGRHELLTGKLLASPQTLTARPVPEGSFSGKAVDGDSFRIVRHASWLTLFDRQFLKDAGITYAQSGKDDNHTGRCAIAAAQRISVSRDIRAYMHEPMLTVDSYTEEMGALYDYLNAHGLYEDFGYRFAHSMLIEIAGMIREFGSDERRYRILDYLKSDAFKKMDILGRDENFYRYRDSIKEDGFLRIVLNRYEKSLAATKKAGSVIVVKEGTAYKDTAEGSSACTGSSASAGSPAVSVIIPVYNTEKYVQESVNQILSQTLRDIELICIDDGSTDSSADILLKLAESDDRITILHQENSGISAARNRGFEWAKGKYIYYMDSDDCLVPHALEEAYKKAEAEDLEAVFFNGINFYDDSYLQNKDMKLTNSGRLVNKDFKKARAVAAWLQFVRKDFLLSHGITFHEGIFYEDSPYTGILCAHLTRYAFIDRVFYRRRIRPDSVTTVTKTFDHSYGYFVGACDLTEAYYELKDSLSDENEDELLHRIAYCIYKSRQYYMLTPRAGRGEEYGLLSDHALFRSLITFYCIHAEESRRANAEAASLREKLKKE